MNAIAAHVGELLLVDDGTPAERAPDLARLADAAGATLLRLPGNSGKGHAIRAGLRYLRARPGRAPAAVLVIDADGQHPPDAIPALVAQAADAEMVIGDRFGDLRAMPWERRAMNRAARYLLEWTTGRAVRDSQCGLRLLRGRALSEVPFPGGRYESETRHLKRCLQAGVRVTWVGIPALYGDERSSFRPVRDTALVLRALVT